MDRRLQFHEILKEVLGSSNVYYQPPKNIEMKYPAIVYHRDRIETEYGNNYPYLTNNRYTVMYIDRRPDSLIPDELAKLQMSSHTASYIADNLSHNVFSIYY